MADFWTFESEPPDVLVRNFAQLDEAVAWIAHRRLSGVLTQHMRMSSRESGPLSRLGRMAGPLQFSGQQEGTHFSSPPRSQTVAGIC